jgi:RND family efflux transporter MFP subunit
MNTAEHPVPVPPSSEPPLNTSATPPRLGRVTVVIIGLIVIGLLAGFIPRWKQRSNVVAATADLSIPSVTVVSPSPSVAVAGLTLPAEVRPLLEAPIFARANGYVKRWLVDIGAHVEAGQLLAEIDIPELNQQLEQARAEQTQAEASLALAKTTAERWTDLLKSASVSEQETAEKQADYKLKTATVEAARANVHRLEELVSFSRVTAPFAGTVTARNIDVGDLIVAGSGRELFRLAQTRTLRVYVRVPQTASRDIAIGQTAEVTIPEIPGRVFPAKVVSTSGAMSTDSRTLLTQLEVDNSKDEILAGSYAQVRFIDAKISGGLTIPANTLLFRAEGPQVGVVKNNTVELHNIAIGRDLGQTIEIAGGVTAQDKIVINPSDSLVSGTTVHVTEAPKIN